MWPGIQIQNVSNNKTFMRDYTDSVAKRLKISIILFNKLAFIGWADELSYNPTTLKQLRCLRNSYDMFLSRGKIEIRRHDRNIQPIPYHPHPLTNVFFFRQNLHHFRNQHEGWQYVLRTRAWFNVSPQKNGFAFSFAFVCVFSDIFHSLYVADVSI